MQRIFATGKPLQQTHKRTVGAAIRAFASSPQPNPFDKSIKTSLEHGGSKHNFYKLPALADPRTGKNFFFYTESPTNNSALRALCSHPPLLDPRAPRECRP